ncbi:unnamed protein product [Closterium sp. NIES-53]
MAVGCPTCTNTLFTEALPLPLPYPIPRDHFPSFPPSPRLQPCFAHIPPPCIRVTNALRPSLPQLPPSASHLLLLYPLLVHAPTPLSLSHIPLISHYHFPFSPIPSPQASSAPHLRLLPPHLRSHVCPTAQESPPTAQPHCSSNARQGTFASLPHTLSLPTTPFPTPPSSAYSSMPDSALHLLLQHRFLARNSCPCSTRQAEAAGVAEVGERHWQRKRHWRQQWQRRGPRGGGREGGRRGGERGLLMGLAGRQA